MKSFATLAIALSLLAAGTVSVSAEGKSASAPGQDRVCLITAKTGTFNDDDVIDAKWLPRKAAKAQASKNPSRIRIFDYTTDGMVGPGKTYASAEELCKTHFD